MNEKMEKKRLAILAVLKDANGPISSSKVAGELTAGGCDLSERTVRFYLKSMDAEGMTQNFGRRGRSITETGLRRLECRKALEKVGFLSAKIDQMAYAMDFDLDKRSGRVVVNMSLLRPEQLLRFAPVMMSVFAQGLAMGRLMALFRPGERVGDMVVPDKTVGVGTVCSITLNGVLLKHGVPTVSRFGGLVEVQDGRLTRFLEIITYDGTSLDPLEIFIRSGMTDYTGAVTTGNGRIGASFREFPSVSRNRVCEVADRLQQVGLGALRSIGHPGQPLLEIPVHEGRFGAVVIGGLNPVAAVEEKGERVQSRALAGLVEYSRLFPYEELEDRARQLT
jgi:repressor of nif and glnA expression